MKSVCLVVACAFIIFGATAIVIAVDGGVQDTDMPTPTGECHTGLGCHTVRNADGIINLNAIANDGEWNTPGESGSLKVTVNIDLADSEDDLAGIMLLDADSADNIKAAGWIITSDPNSNPQPHNYNLKDSVIEDVDFIWTVNAPESLRTYRIFARVLFDDRGPDHNVSDTVEISFPVGASERVNHKGLKSSVLLSSRPNPFSETTTIFYQPPVSGYAALKVYDMAGRLVRDLSDGKDT